MLNRSWFNSELNNNDYNSNCDLKVSEILNRFSDMCFILTNKRFENLDEAYIYLCNNDSLLINFNKWFFEVGYSTLIQLSEIKLGEDSLFVEDLNYLIFCLDSIFINFNKYLEDNFLTFLDIIFYLEEKLLKK